MKSPVIDPANANRCNELMPDLVIAAAASEGLPFDKGPGTGAVCDKLDGHDGPHAWRRALRTPIEWGFPNPVPENLDDDPRLWTGQTMETAVRDHGQPRTAREAAAMKADAAAQRDREMAEAAEIRAAGVEQPIRDNGPYLTADQAAAQFDSVSFNVPPGALSGAEARGMVFFEALLVTGATPSDFERLVVTQLSRTCNSVTAQVIAGWIVRAHLAGRETGA